ncbi:neuropeptide Y receptor type 1-like [Dendronephthya gigantea]|uniref:neuropeptide Y receptor type 1-like n=1 Tax=Dendronephthya gigantea TaxID=151771 RepID=UPI00106ABCDC|nr:neuropeptide Y receptor type 1-like [Dendronephthya gigantea]
MAADAQAIAIGFFSILAVLLGVPGNTAVIVSICKTRNLLRNSHYYLLLHLAICDLVQLIFFIGDIYTVFNDNTEVSSSSRILCKIWSPTYTSCFIAGVYFLVLISVSRYRAIVQPFKPPISRKMLKIYSASIYLIAVLCIIPYALVLTFDESQGASICYEQWPFQSLNIVYTVFLAIVQYLMPVAFLSVVYFKICKTLVIQSKIVNEHKLRQHGPRQNRKTFLVCFIIVICFAISAGPSQVAWMIPATTSSEISGSMSSWFNVLRVFGTLVINPYVYGAFDKKVFSFFFVWLRIGID